MPERKNDGILPLTVKKLLILYLVWKTSRALVREFIFHYAINFCAYLKRQLT